MVLIGFTTGELSASWAEMTVEELVRSSELIVLGTLVSLRPQPNGRFDIGTIKVEEVIMGRKDLMEVSLVVPSRDREIRISTDIM